MSSREPELHKSRVGKMNNNVLEESPGSFAVRGGRFRYARVYRFVPIEPEYRYRLQSFLNSEMMDFYGPGELNPIHQRPVLGREC